MRLLNRFVFVACLFLVAGAWLRPVTPKPFVPQVRPGEMDVLYAAPGDLNYAYGPQGAALRALTSGDRPASATFQVTYNGFSPAAQAAFQAAINIWAAAITSPAPIRITANWTPLGSGVLGSAGSSAGCTVTGGVASTFYAAALADKINGSAFCAAAAGAPNEINANFNSSFSSWDFGTSGVGVPGQYNFMTVVLHEVGHGLGFFGRFTSSGGVGTLSSSLPYIYDRFTTVGPGGPLLLTIPRPSTTLGSQLVSNNTYWNGANAPNAKVETHDMSTFGYTTDNGWLQGSSYSHVDDVQYSGTPNGLMTFQLAANEVYTDPGPVMRGMFKDEGWTVSSGALHHTFGDFNGDGNADLSVFRPNTGQWFINGIGAVPWGIPGDVPVPGDYNGDGNTDVVVYRPSSGIWYFNNGTPAVQWGRAGDIPVPGAYAVANTTQVAVYRTTDNGVGTWYIPGLPAIIWGVRGDIPVPADFDGDGRSDIAVYRPSTGVWYMLSSSSGFAASTSRQFGLPGDVPVAADYDGDGKADNAVWRPSSGLWFVFLSASSTVGNSQLGGPGDIPVPLDTNGNGSAEPVIFRPGTGQWFIYTGGAPAVVPFGLTGDVPTAERPRLPTAPNSDFDGDGRSDISVFRPSTGQWFVKFSSTNYGTFVSPQFGLNGDIRVPGDYDGDHRTDLAVYRPSNGTWYAFSSSNGAVFVMQFGLSTDTPVPADFDGDGKTDLAVYRPSTGQWFIKTSSSGYLGNSVTQWGLNGDKPFAADFDGDGRADLAVYRPSTGQWYLLMSTPTYGTSIIRQWGLAGDVPIVADFDGDGRAELAVYRPSNGTWYALDVILGAAIINGQQWGLSADTPNPHDFDGDGRADLAVYRNASGEWFVRASSSGGLIYVQWGLSSDLPVWKIDDPDGWR
jgi:hypothetical protein